MNFHKSIPILYTNIYNAKTKKEANEIIKQLLKSFKIQIDAGVNSLDAFENSIMNPSLKMNIDKEELARLLKLNKSKKFMFLFRYEDSIKILKSGGSSMEKIANYLNAHKTPKRRRPGQDKISINKMDISRFCKERDIK
jgi:hypothetical protein